MVGDGFEVGKGVVVADGGSGVSVGVIVADCDWSWFIWVMVFWMVCWVVSIWLEIGAVDVDGDGDGELVVVV